jgi:hypothetical protein
MPQYVYNILEVYGPESDVREFISKSAREEAIFSFEALLPVPEELKQGPASEINDWKSENWGTEYDPYNDDSKPWEIYEDKALIPFISCWNPPTVFLENVSTLFPTLTFFNQFADEGINFVGTETFRDGELIEEEDFFATDVVGMKILENLGLEDQVLYVEEE